ncbi:MAG: NAD(P)H-dependent oxidoreductase [Alphaproteobacteria bacterium]|nr:NAD(P)H-dependent oxidoreductase [Alphaproteobacteria bacterium]MBL7097760.1 NAD(P)H-dependent oxidoreductase [Alphaproteobacteria bacterium]
MKHAVIVAHPSVQSFTSSMASSYRETGLAAGHDVIYRDLYRINFDPCLLESELPWSKSPALRDDVIAEREVLKDADVFALFYPLWLNAPPAILKGYLERVFGMGFAYQRKGSGNAPMLKGKRLISFTNSGAPTEWVIQSGAWQAMRTLFDGHLAAVCGLEVVDHIHFGSVVPGIRADSVHADMAKVAKTFEKHFAATKDVTGAT